MHTNSLIKHYYISTLHKVSYKMLAASFKNGGSIDKYIIERNKYERRGEIAIGSLGLYVALYLTSLSLRHYLCIY